MTKDILISKPTNHYHKHFLKAWWLKLHPDAPERIAKHPTKTQNAICAWFLLRAKVGSLAYLKTHNLVGEVKEFLNLSEATVKSHLELLERLNLLKVTQKDNATILSLGSMDRLNEFLSIERKTYIKNNREVHKDIRVSVNLCKLTQLDVKELRYLLARMVIDRSLDRQRFTIVKKLTEDAVLKAIGPARNISKLREAVSKNTIRKVYRAKAAEIRKKVGEGYLERCCRSFDPFAENILFNPNITNSRKGLGKLLGRTAMTASNTVSKLLEYGFISKDEPHFAFLRNGSYDEFTKLRSIMHHYWLTWSNGKIFIRFANNLVLA